MYHSKTDTLVMTNEPDLPKQKELLKKYSDWGGDIELPDGLPGSVSSPDRFVRLEYYLQYLPEPSTDAEPNSSFMILIYYHHSKHLSLYQAIWRRGVSNLVE